MRDSIALTMVCTDEKSHRTWMIVCVSSWTSDVADVQREVDRFTDSVQYVHFQDELVVFWRFETSTNKAWRTRTLKNKAQDPSSSRNGRRIPPPRRLEDNVHAHL